jgi:hypothetical protein
MFAPSMRGRVRVNPQRKRTRVYCAAASREGARRSRLQILLSISQNRHSIFSRPVEYGTKRQIYRNCALIFPEKCLEGMSNAERREMT